MHTVYQHDKRSGPTYAHEPVARWDPPSRYRTDGHNPCPRPRDHGGSGPRFLGGAWVPPENSRCERLARVFKGKQGQADRLQELRRARGRLRGHLGRGRHGGEGRGRLREGVRGVRATDAAETRRADAVGTQGCPRGINCHRLTREQ